METSKQCAMCAEVKPTSEFHKDRGRKGGFAARCKECRKKEKQPKRFWRSKYGITTCDFAAMRIKANDKCEICGLPETKPGLTLSVDHCHETGVVRGLLCSSCNLGIGSLRDSIQNLESAIAYLERTSLNKSSEGNI